MSDAVRRPGTRPTKYARNVLTFLTAGAAGLGLAIVPAAPASAVPTFSVTTVVSGLEIPWDLTWVGTRMLYTLRKGEVWTKSGSSAPQRVLDLRSQTYANSEGGLLGIVADPAATSNRIFYTCGTFKTGDTKVDVRVRRWTLNSAGTSASDGTVLLAGIPLGSGRHSGCRLRFGTDGLLYVGTGDAAQAANPQNRQSLGGKVLRINPTGGAPTDNPYYGEGGNARYVWTYGHRNVQGLALRPGTSELWSAEHGSTRDDEINRLSRGGNYGWDPLPAPYTEGSNPMTDTTKFPNAVRAVWSSGSPTLATSGLTFLTGSAWGRWQGAMAVGLLKDEGINIVSLTPGGALAKVEPLAVAERGDRIRAVQQGPDGALYYTTSNGSADKIMRLAPRPERALPAYRAGVDVSPVGVAAARTGSEIYVFVRSTGDSVYYRRSTDDGRTWGSWTNTGVRSTSAPAVTSSAAGRIDLITRSAADSAVHTWFTDGAKAGQRDLGGVITAAPAVTSLSDGTLDVFVRGQGSYGAFRNRMSGGRWSGWQGLGGVFSSALAASADRANDRITVTGRGTGGGAHVRTVTATSNGSAWSGTGLLMWSGRALSDKVSSAAAVGVHVGSDGNAVVDRGGLVQGVVAGYDSFPAVVSRENGTWMMFGRASANGQLYYYDARSGGYRNISLGGTVR